MNRPMVWDVYPQDLRCPSSHLTLPPLEACVRPEPFTLRWSAHMPLWTAAMWFVVFGTFLIGLASSAWVTYPRGGAVAMSLILAMHVPLAAHTPFLLYMAGTGAAITLPLFLFACRSGRAVYEGAAKFRLPSRATTEGIGLYAVFCLFQAIILSLAMVLRS
ncbi:MAG: hypothetical protein JKY23_06055 [Nitrospinaceae bacterium]|nr:hypothetical protein [Nitrospinaceae bacterium]